MKGGVGRAILQCDGHCTLMLLERARVPQKLSKYYHPDQMHPFNVRFHFIGMHAT